MGLVDRGAEQEMRRRRALRRLAVDLRQARLNATPAEAARLLFLVEDCADNSIEPDEARRHVLDMRRDQQARHAA